MNPKLSYLLLLVFILASCSREQEWDGSPDINAKVESEQKTRTSISVDESGTGTIYWNPSDRIDVFFGTKKAQYMSQNASDAIAATFKTSDSVSSSDVSSTNIWGLYPSNSSSSCNGSSITTTLPSTQYGVPNTFDKDIFPAVARSSSTNLQFYNVCGGIKFNMAYDDIKKVTFKGNNNENIAGTVSIKFSNGAPQATVTSGVKQITLTPKSGSTFTKDTDYYITLLPGTLSKGFTMTFTATDGTVGTLNYTDASVTIKRSIFSRKGNMDVYAAFGDGRQSNKVIYYTSKERNIVTPYKTDVFGANIVSNEYVGGRGIITFGGEVTSIGMTSFLLCNDLTSIEIPNSVTAIGESAFWECRSLTSVVIPSSVSDISSSAFNYCNSLVSFVVSSENPTFDSRNHCNAIIRTQTNMLLAGCGSTIIPDSVEWIGNYAFRGCTNLVSIVIPNSVHWIGSFAFHDCTSLTSVEIPSSVYSIGVGGNSFSNCPGLTTIVVDNGNYSYDSRNNCNAIIETDSNTLIVGCKNTIIPDSVTSIGSQAFFGCSSLATIDIPDSVISIASDAFFSCSGLSSIVIPASVTSIGSFAFQYCSGLASITVLASTPPSLGNAYVFSDTNNCPIYVPAGSVDAYKSAWSEYADRIQAIPDTHEAVDLGLSVKWATCNVGADTPDGYGDYFAWGETEPKSNYAWSTYEWCNGSQNTLTKYCDKSSYGYNGFIDNKTVLDLEDDAAHVNWGGSWRMPTDAESTELRNNCTWTWTTQNGVDGYRVTSNKAGYTDKSIFLPAAGFQDGIILGSVGTNGEYSSSSLYTDYPFFAWGVSFYFSGTYSIHGYGGSYRYIGCSVCPGFGGFISFEKIFFNKRFFFITGGGTSQLSATVSPSTATAKTVSWSSSNTNVATVSYQGVVTAVSAGTATITVWSSDGQKSATCTVTVTPLHEAVDLGLSVKWATCNVGADTPEGYGDYYAWGETEPKSNYAWSTYKWCEGSENTLTKYCNLSSYGYNGFRDFISFLEQEDDAAHVNWGGFWRMPTVDEWTELRTNCTWTWTTQNGVNGYRVTSNKTGYTEKSIFLPAAGWSLSFGGGTYGDYWATSIPNYNPSNAFVTHFESSYYDYSAGDRCDGLSIRPVTE